MALLCPISRVNWKTGGAQPLFVSPFIFFFIP
jgi:hypothetical protein